MISIFVHYFFINAKISQFQKPASAAALHRACAVVSSLKKDGTRGF